MLPKVRAQEIQAFSKYKSADGSTGVTNTTAGLVFKNGIYVGGDVSGVIGALSTTNITISGSAGNGYIQYGAQTVAPALALVHTYADSGGHFAIGQSGSSGKTIVFTNGLMTANRDYAFQNKSGTLAMVDDNLSQFNNDTGFVTGPSFSTDNRIASFDLATGKLIKDSGINIVGTVNKTLTLTGSLTVGADASITGGGTLALAGFTFTVPATGTGVITSRLVSAGSGLSGGGDLSADRTISMPNVGTSGLKTFATGDLLTTDSQGRITSVITVTRSITEGNGLAGNTYDLSANRTLALGTPSTNSVSSTNALTATSHTHAITSSSNPSAAASILASDSSGFLRLVRLGIGTAPTQPLHVAGNAFIDASTANLYMKDTSTGLQVSTTGIINPQSGNMFRNTAYTSGLVGWYISDPGNAEFNNVDIRGAIHASVIVYGQVTATAGTILTSKSAAKLKSDATIPSSPTYGTTTVNVDAVDADGLSHASSQLFAINDILYLKDGLAGATWLKVSSVSDQTTFWRYTCTIQAGTNNVTYRAGLGVADYGGSGSGFIVQTADATNAPYLQMATHAGTFSSANSSGTLVVTVQLRLGNLNGSYGYVINTYGLGVGDYGVADSWLTVDPTNGLQIFGGAGAVTLDGTGLQVEASATLGVSENSVTWKDGANTVGQLATVSTSLVAYTTLKTFSLLSSDQSTNRIISQNNSSEAAAFELTMFGSSVGGGLGSKSFAGFFGNGFTGLTIGGLVSSATVPAHMLDVYGNGWFSGNVATLTVVDSRASGSSPSARHVLKTGSREYQIVNDGGFSDVLYIYDATAGAIRLQLSTAGLFRFNAYGAGTLTTDASGNITATSDERLKTRIRQFRKGLDTIKKLEPILYRWNKKSGLDAKNDYVGFGARHTKKHLHEAIGKGSNGFHTINDRAILAVVVNSIKELEQKYESLSRAVTA